MDNSFTRKHYFINKGLQLRYLFSFIIPMSIFLILFCGIMAMLSQGLVERTIIEVKSDVEAILQNNSRNLGEQNEMYRETERQLRVKFLEYSTGDNEFIFGIIKKTLIILGSGMLVILVVLGMLTVYMSHKIAGPNYRFGKFAESLKDGEINSRIFLRTGDEFQGTADSLNAMAESFESLFLGLKKSLAGAKKSLETDDKSTLLSNIQRGENLLKSLRFGEDLK